MKRTITVPLGIGLTVLAFATSSDAGVNWPQFRGNGGLALSETDRPPVVFGPRTNLVWRTEVPSGASSPIVWEDRIFLTAFSDGQLRTLCIRRGDGEVLWEKAAPSEHIERFHPQEGSPAASTPVTDGKRVYVYFASFGLLAYDLEGAELWLRPLPPLESFGGFGSGASPVLAGGLIILNLDGVGAARIMAVDANSGEIAWTTDRGHSYGWSSPFIWEHDGVQEIVLPASAVLKSYDLRTGAERWKVRGIAAATCATPAAADGLLFVSSWSPADSSQAPPPFQTVLERSDKDKDGAISMSESEGSDLRVMFHTFDLNRDHLVSREEYDQLRSLALRSKSVLVAIRPGGSGDITDSHVVWRQTRGLPYVSSPLLYQGRLYLVKDGGLVSCYEAESGKPVYVQERLGAAGNYYASPVAGNGRIYLTSVSGIVTVLEPGDTFKVLARNELGERISATPAIVEDTLYVRTANHLFAFKEDPSNKGASAGSGPKAVDEFPLFDGRTLNGWRVSDFTGTGKVEVQDGRILLHLGYMTGITWTNGPPRMNFEISLEAMRVEGSDFFCGLTFPVGESHCSLIVGGWGGNLVGLSSIDYADAANNETTKFLQFDTGRWYKIRLRVLPETIQAWIDDKPVVDVKTTDRKISIRLECEPSVPLGIATYATTAALRNIVMRQF